MERFLYGEESRKKRKGKKETFYIILALNLNVIKFNCLLTINLYEIYSSTSKDLISIKLGRVLDNGAIKIRKMLCWSKVPSKEAYQSWVGGNSPKEAQANIPNGKIHKSNSCRSMKKSNPSSHACLKDPRFLPYQMSPNRSTSEQK